MKRSFIIAGILIFVFSQTTTAQKKLTVEEAIANALKNNYDILLLKNDSTSFALDNSYAKAAFLPRVNANTGILFNNNNQKQKLADGKRRNPFGQYKRISCTQLDSI